MWTLRICVCVSVRMCVLHLLSFTKVKFSLCFMFQYIFSSAIFTNLKRFHLGNQW